MGILVCSIFRHTVASSCRMEHGTVEAAGPVGISCFSALIETTPKTGGCIPIGVRLLGIWRGSTITIRQKLVFNYFIWRILESYAPKDWDLSGKICVIPADLTSQGSKWHQGPPNPPGRRRCVAENREALEFFGQGQGFSIYIYK